MAHGYLKALGKGKINVLSAGVETHGLNQDAVESMKRDGIDISDHTSNLMSDDMDIDFDVVITVCDNANERCPYFPGKVLRIHQNFEDPSKATLAGDDRAQEFDRIRNKIRGFSQNFLDQL